MAYECRKCGRTFIYDELVSFCPFCGQAYNSMGQNEMSMRISIGSDSERTVQEKYWRLTRQALESALADLWDCIPRFSLIQEDEEDAEIPESYTTVPLFVHQFMVLKNSSSFTMFRNNLNRYLSDLELVCRRKNEILNLAARNVDAYQKEIVALKLSFELGEWAVEDLEDEYSIDFDKEAEFIQEFCLDLAEGLGNLSPERMDPEPNYDGENIDWQAEIDACKPEKFPKFTKDHIELVNAIRKTSDVVMRAVQDNSTFILSAMKNCVDEKFNPKVHIGRLHKLAEADYDPLFGDPPEELIEAFSDAVVNVSVYLNNLPDYEDAMEYAPKRLIEKLKQRLDELKLDALKSYTKDWFKQLHQELDRLYQNQKENMIDVYNEIEQLTQRLDNEEA